MRLFYFFLFIVLVKYEIVYGQTQPVSATSSAPASQTTVDGKKLSELESTVAELKSRLDQSTTNNFPIGRLAFAKTVNIITPTPKALEFFPSQLRDSDKEKIINNFRQGYRSSDFSSDESPSRTISYRIKRRGLFGSSRFYKLSITAPQSQALATIDYNKIIRKRDFKNPSEQQAQKALKAGTDSVKHVLISLQSGMISRIEVDAGGRKFSNQRAPILLRRIGPSYTNRLFSEDGKQYITFGQQGGIIKSYFPYTSKPYLIDDQEYHFIPSKTDKEDTLLLNLKTDSDNYVKVRFFTDLLGLANQRNPVTQIEGTVRVVLNSIAFANSRKFMIQHIQLRVGNGHFDSKQDTLRLTGQDTARTELFRKANWYANLKLAILSHRGNTNFDLLIGLEGRLVKHVYADQLKDQTVLVGGPLAEAAFQYTMGPNASLNLLAGTVFSRANKKPDIPNNDRWFAIPYLSAEADYAPFNSPSSRIFFRLNHYWNWTISEPTITQAQLGYSGTLNGILGKK